MTSAQAIERVRLLIDSIGSPYFEDSEILDFLNIAQLEVLNRMVPDSLGGVVTLELDQNTLENIRPIIYTITTGPTAGLLLTGNIVNNLRSDSGDSTCSLFRVLNIAVNSSNQLVRFVKHNSLYAHMTNVFKAPATTDLAYTSIAGGFQLYPITTNVVMKMTVIKTPKIMTDSNTPDWDDYVMNQVILQAVKLIGVPTRDEELIADARNTGIQSAQ
jgi:hypothetical protein